jgi:xylulokinase
VRDHLAKDEINLYLDKLSVVDGPECRYRSMYDFLIESIAQVPAGSGGVIFAPWLHGNRSPFEDPAARGMFFNISLETGKRALIRSVVEGVILHQRWLLESIKKHFPVTGALRFAGGGALSPSMAQIMADILGHRVVTVDNPQNCGAAGAALTAAIGLGWIPDFSAVKGCVAVGGEYWPRPEVDAVYDQHFDVLKRLYAQNRPIFAELNGPDQVGPREK